MTINKSIDMTDLPLTIFLIVIGVFGAVLSMKHYERFARHQTLAGAYRAALDQEVPEAQILGIRSKAERCHTNNYRLVHKWRLHWLWIGLHAAVALTGVFLTVGILIGWFK